MPKTAFVGALVAAAPFLLSADAGGGIGPMLRAMEPQRRLEAAAYMAAMSGPPPDWCFVENGFDYVGEDIKNVPGATPESCCYQCTPWTTSGCNAYSWTNHNGGTCWLKKTRGQIVVNPNVKSALFFLGQRELCAVKENVDFVGNDIGNASSATAEPCCDKCRAFLGCRAYSWSNQNGGTCWFKSKRGEALVKSGVRSADVYPNEDYSTVCAQEMNVDYVGFDIGNAASASATGCCSICRNYAKCRSYSWSNYNGGTCWLKSFKGEAVAKPGLVSAQVWENPQPYCNFEMNVDYAGNDIGNVASKDPGLCCPICRDQPDCKAVTWSDYNGGTCWLKSAKGATATKAGVQSAVTV